MRTLWGNLTGVGGLLRVRSIAFLSMLGVSAYLFVETGGIPQELLSLDLAYGGFYFGGRSVESAVLTVVDRLNGERSA